jgi:hypothetical protein
MLPGSGVCAQGCNWVFPGWVAYNAVTGKVKFTKHEALVIAPLHKWDPVRKTRTAPSYPKLVAILQTHGYSYGTDAPSQPTFINVEAY